MVITTLRGGIGNQLFQYAAGRALAERNSQELYLDLSELERDATNYTKREFELHQVNYRAKIAEPYLLNQFKKEGILPRIKNKLQIGQFKVFNENRFDYMPRFRSLNGNILLQGYWQTENYFKEIRPQLLKEISPAYKLSAYGESLLSDIRMTNSVSVHVRRGDYLSLPNAGAHHVVQSVNYYKEAANFLSQRVSGLSYFVFSDDISWCKENLDFLKPVVFAESNEIRNSSEDLFLMSQCSHNVIANSSYSWWAAWLNSSPEKIVIAPEMWFHDKSINTEDLLPASWIKLK